MSARDEMRCRELVEVVGDYLEGRLPADDRRRLEEHLRETRGALLEAFRGWRER